MKNRVKGKATELKGKATGNKGDELQGKAHKLLVEVEQTVKSLAYDAEHRKRS